MTTSEAPSQQDLLATAHRIADEVLFPAAIEADQAGHVPERQLQCLVDAGFYGISTWCDSETIAKIIEVVASGCLTTTFVWTQHLGVAAAAKHTDNAAVQAMAPQLASGETRGGVAFAHMLRGGPPLTTAEPVDGGWLYAGSAPWVTGWGHIDVVHAAARHGDDIVWALIDAVDSDTLRSTSVTFAVVDSTQTRVLAYDGHFVPAERITKVENYAEWRERYKLGLRTNGSLALGVASRCCRLLDDTSLFAELNLLRDRLNMTAATDHAAMSAARADASLFAVRAATALVAKVGGNAVMQSEHAQRLLREAMFVLVQGQTPSIKSEMLSRLSGG